MTATSKHFIVRRAFRGSTLFLVRVDVLGCGWRWHADRGFAFRFTESGPAMRAAERASREYGARAFVEDSDGCLLEPAKALAAIDGYHTTRTAADGEPTARWFDHLSRLDEQFEGHRRAAAGGFLSIADFASVKREYEFLKGRRAGADDGTRRYPPTGGAS